MRNAFALVGQLIRCCRSTRVHLGSSSFGTAANSISSPANPELVRDLRKFLLNRPYGEYVTGGKKGKGKKGGVTADPEDEKMLSEGGGSKDNFAKECSRVKRDLRSSTIEKVLPGKRNEHKRSPPGVSVRKAVKVAKKVTDKAKKGVDKVKKKTKETVKKVKDTGKKAAKKVGGGGGGGGKKKGGGGSKKGGKGGGGKKGGSDKKGGGGGKKGGKKK